MEQHAPVAMAQLQEVAGQLDAQYAAVIGALGGRWSRLGRAFGDRHVGPRRARGDACPEARHQRRQPAGRPPRPHEAATALVSSVHPPAEVAARVDRHLLHVATHALDDERLD